VRLKSSLQSVANLGSRKWILVVAFLGLAGAISAAVIPNLFPFLDPTGLVSTYNVNGPIEENNNPFFQSLGTNGRSCSTCHIAGNALGLSVDNIRQRFESTRGRDPLFASVDGANCPGASPDNPAAHSLLLKNGLIRIPLQMPPNPQFTIQALRDPYGCAVVTDPTSGLQTVSVYRRPLPTANLRFLSAVMFDGRETVQALTNPATFQANLVTDLLHQAVDATLIHAQAAAPPTLDQQNAIVNFELGLSSAQSFDFRAGALNSDGAHGGPATLSQQPYYPGINDVLGQDPEGNPFNSTSITLFAPWANLKSSGFFFGGEQIEARKRIAAGEALFNTRALTITNVRGLNDNVALAAALGTTVPIASFPGTCTTCHDAPNVGDHSLPLALDIGTGHDPSTEHDPIIASAVAELGFPDVPVFKITGCPNPFATTPAAAAPYIIYTTDPGKALISGLCSDVSRTKGPILRGLAARAPYFHNGAAQNLDQVLNFYNLRFQMNLTDEEKKDLTAFLNSL
jgi:cytochrome c peroxidase